MPRLCSYGQGSQQGFGGKPTSSAYRPWCSNDHVGVAGLGNVGAFVLGCSWVPKPSLVVSIPPLMLFADQRTPSGSKGGFEGRTSYAGSEAASHLVTRAAIAIEIHV